MSKDYASRAKNIMQRIMYATVATASKDGKPWNSPVAYFYDDLLNIYWFSDKDSVHSGNIKENKDIFIVIYDSTMKEGTGEGVFIQAIAQEINEVDEINRIAKLQVGTMALTPEKCLGDAIHRFYKATSKRVWVNDDGFSHPLGTSPSKGVSYGHVYTQANPQ